jgi:capsid protein
LFGSRTTGSAPAPPKKNTRRRRAFKAAAVSARRRGGRHAYARVSPQVDKEWETHIISLNQNIKDAVAAHKRHRKFVDVMEGRGFAPVSALSDEPPVVVAGAEDAVTVDVGGEVVEEAARYAEREL